MVWCGVAWGGVLSDVMRCGVVWCGVAWSVE